MTHRTYTAGRRVNALRPIARRPAYTMIRRGALFAAAPAALGRLTLGRSLLGARKPAALLERQG